MKKQTVSSLKKKVWAIFSQYIRLRDCLKTTGSPKYGECISCSKTYEFHRLDAGHFVPKRGANYFSEGGVNAQCRHCNSYLHGNQLGYRRGLVELYGEEVVKELEVENIPAKKFTISELRELEASLKEKIKLLEG